MSIRDFFKKNCFKRVFAFKCNLLQLTIQKLSYIVLILIIYTTQVWVYYKPLQFPVLRLT